MEYAVRTVSKPKDVYDLVLQLRDAVEEADVHSKLTTPQWFVPCAAMDAVEDTQQAVEAYTEKRPDTEKSRPKGERYLRAYGALQVLFVQQDATKNLCDALSAPNLWDATPVEGIRELRTISVGHPTLRRKTQTRPQSSHFIVQMSLGEYGFQVHSVDSAGNRSYQTVPIPSLAATQSAHIRATLEKAIEHIAKKWPH